MAFTQLPVTQYSSKVWSFMDSTGFLRR